MQQGEEHKSQHVITRVYTNKLLALFILRYARIREIMKVRLLNKAIYTRIDEDIFWLLVYKQLTVTKQSIRVIPQLPAQFLTTFDFSLDIWKNVVSGITKSIAFMNKSEEFQKFMKVEEALKNADGEVSTAGLNENTVSYNIGGYGSLGELPKEPSQLIIDNAKYDFLASFNSRFIHEGKIRFLSLVSLPNPKFFSSPNLDTYDTMLLIYDPSIEPQYHVQKVMSQEQDQESKHNTVKKVKEYTQKEIKEIHSHYTEIMQKCKEGNMFSVLLVINTSLLQDDTDDHPIVKAYRKQGFTHPVVKIDKFGENAITLLYNIVLKLAEPERVERIAYYKKKREEREKAKQEEQKESEPQKKQNEKKKSGGSKCIIF